MADLRAAAIPVGLGDGILIAGDGSLTSGKWTLGLLSGPMGVAPDAEQHVLRRDDLHQSLCGLYVNDGTSIDSSLGPDFGWRVPFMPLDNPWCRSCRDEVVRIESAGRLVRPEERRRRGG